MVGRPAASATRFKRYIMVRSVAETVDATIAKDGQIVQRPAEIVPRSSEISPDPAGTWIALYREPATS